MERESKEHDQDHMLYNTLNTLIKVLRDCDQLLRDEKWSENMNVIWGKNFGQNFKFSIF